MRLIDADEAKRFAAECWPNPVHRLAIDALLDNCPTVDLKDLRPHGRWLEIPNAYVSVASTDGSYHGCATSCSACGEVNPNAYKTNYCPNCGAKMIEEVLNA